MLSLGWSIIQTNCHFVDSCRGIYSKAGSPPSDVVLSVRSSLTGADLVSLSKPASQIPTSNGWVEFDFSDLTVTPGGTYYLVLRTTGGTSANCYSWGYGSATPYTNGALWFSTNTGGSWSEFPWYDFCFKTYGMSGPSAPVLCLQSILV